MKEEWRVIPGFEGRYEVSNQGKVRSVTHAVHAKQDNWHNRNGEVKSREFVRITKSRPIIPNRYNKIKGTYTYHLHRYVDGKQTSEYFDDIDLVRLAFPELKEN